MCYGHSTLQSVSYNYVIKQTISQGEGCRPGRNDKADVAASKAEGRLRLDMPKPQTIADGLQGRMGDLTWPVVRDLVDAVVTACAV